MPTVSINIDDRLVLESLRELSGRMEDPSPVLKILGDRMLLQTERRFYSQGPAPDGTPWAQLKKSTLKRKKHPKILTESGHLRDKIRYQLLGPRSLAVGSAEPYARIHQLGGSIHRDSGSATVRHRTDAKGSLLRTGLFGGKGLIFAKGSHRRALTRTFASRAHDVTIPARPFLGVSHENSVEICGLIRSYVVKGEK